MIIRKAAEPDLPRLMKIEEECFGWQKFSPETVKAFVERSDSFALMAVNGREILGTALGIMSDQASEGKIASIAVLRKHRGKGIGAELLVACETEFQSRSLRRYSLEVETENEPAISLYLRKGYEAKGVIRDFYSAGRHAYCMEKKVSSEHSVQIKPY